MESSGQPFGEVVRDVSAMTVFTTHTPVAAGHDRFPAPLVEEHLGKIREALHLSYDDFMGLGRVYPADPHEPFCMTVLALKLSRYANGVSALHGTVSRRMWQPLYRRTAPRKTCRSATSPTASTCRAGSRPRCTSSSTATWAPTGTGDQRHPETWAGDRDVEDAELWETQQISKARLINFVRNRLAAQARRRDEPRGGDRPGHGSSRPERPDDRLRTAVRHLQARRAGSCRTSSGSIDTGQRRPTGRSSSSSAARPTPRTAWARS